MKKESIKQFEGVIREKNGVLLILTKCTVRRGVFFGASAPKVLLKEKIRLYQLH